MKDAIELVASLAERAFAVRETALRMSPEIVVDPAVPILYFGDLENYLASPRRVVTVALNPSRAEFPSSDLFQRFPLATGGAGPSDDYLAALNVYFKTDPYRRWFSSFEPLLQGLETSYYPGAESTALHTDLCTPVATNPTWSGLDGTTQTQLMDDGVPLWHDLMRVLRPDAIVISVARRHLDKIRFEALGRRLAIDKLESEKRSKPYVTQGWRVSLDSDSQPLVVFGRAANQPFGLVSHEHRTKIGRRIGEVLDHRGDLNAVQFPHPGGEHEPDRPGLKDWNLGDHKRKFMKVSGRWRTSSDPKTGNEVAGEMCFWGEWEPPSRVLSQLPHREPGDPRFLYEPVWTHPPDHPDAQNTDPYVFGDCFHYSNCKQNTRRSRLRTKRLAVGSLILFGSSRKREFVLDTVFVVGNARPLTGENDADLPLHPVFRAVTTDLLFPRNDGQTFTVYEGATPKEPAGGMFSFVPCMPYRPDNPGFPRPKIVLDGVVNPRNTQALKFTRRQGIEEMRPIWLSVVDQVLDQGLSLGIHVATPAAVDSDDPATHSGQQQRDTDRGPGRREPAC